MNVAVIFYHVFVPFMIFVVRSFDASNVTDTFISNATNISSQPNLTTISRNDNLDSVEQNDENQLTLIDWLTYAADLNLTELEDAFNEEVDDEESSDEDSLENFENFDTSSKGLMKENLKENAQNLTNFFIEKLSTNSADIQLASNQTSIERLADLKKHLNDQIKNKSKKSNRKTLNKKKAKNRRKKKRKKTKPKLGACRSHGHNHRRCNRSCKCPCKRCTTTTTTTTTSTTTEATSTSEETTESTTTTTEATTVQASTQPARERRANSNNNRDNTNLVVYTTLCNWKTHLQSKVMRMIYFLNANRPLNYEYYLTNLHEIASSIDGVCSVDQPMKQSMNQQLTTLIRNEQLFNRVGNMLGNFEKAECRLNNFSFPCGQLGL